MKSIIKPLLVVFLIAMAVIIGFVGGITYSRNKPLQTANPIPSITASISSGIPTFTNTLPISGILTTPSVTVTPNVTNTNTAVATASPTTTIDYFYYWDYYRTLLNNNSGCDFPCWLGLRAGISTAQEVVTLFDSLTSFREYYHQDKDSVSAFWWITDGVSPLYSRVLAGAIFDQENDTLEWLIIGTDVYEKDKDIVYGTTMYEMVFHRYLLSEILIKNGMPDEVWLWVHPQVYNTMDLLLYYPDLGMAAKIDTFIRKENSSYQGCPQLGKTTLFLWDPEKDYDLQTAVNRESRGVSHFYFSEDRPEGYMPLETATGWSISDFYTIFQNPENEQCIETEISLWPGP